MTVSIAFYKGKDDLLDRLVQWWTKSPYSHCELVIDGVAYSSSPRDGGMRTKVIDFNPNHWDIIPISADKDACKKWFNDRLGAKYDWLGLLGFIIPMRLESPYRWFCSEAIASALGLPHPWKITPDTLYLEIVTGPQFEVSPALLSI